MIEEAPELPVLETTKKPAYLITLSAKTDAALKERVNDLLTWLNREQNPSLEAISHTLNLGRSHFNKRYAMVAVTIQELKDKLVAIQTNKEKGYFYGDTKKRSEDAAINTKVFDATLQELKENKHQNAKEYIKNLSALANLYVKGYEIDWALLHQDEAKQKISLPTYPFAKEQLLG